jgi:deaminated glutathione amidase
MNTQPPPDRYAALALQFATHCVNDCRNREDARGRMAANLDRLARQVPASKAFIRQFSGQDVRLVVLPEYFLTGFPLGESVAEWRDKAALQLDGPEYRALADIAAGAEVWLAGNAYEVDPHFPEIYFQCCFLISPGRETVLRYRRLISLSTPTPYDVWDRYLEIYGLAGVFPVADTAIGRIGAIASEEILYPEIARQGALRGAELFIHPTSEVGSLALTPKEIARRARAVENLAYVVSANSAALNGTPLPAESTTGMSKVVDYQGQVLGEAAPGGESMVAYGTIDLSALRACRRRTGLTNTLVRQPLRIYQEAYGASVADGGFHPANLLLDAHGKARVPERGEFARWQQADIEKLGRKGLI